MAINVEVKLRAVNNYYPRLMTPGSGIIVYFKSCGVGQVIGFLDDALGPIYKKGEISNHWDMEQFKDFPGTVTLSNQ